jgi:hypothetical protein
MARDGPGRRELPFKANSKDRVVLPGALGFYFCRGPRKRRQINPESTA